MLAAVWQWININSYESLPKQTSLSSFRVVVRAWGFIRSLTLVCACIFLLQSLFSSALQLLRKCSSLKCRFLTSQPYGEKCQTHFTFYHLSLIKNQREFTDYRLKVAVHSEGQTVSRKNRNVSNIQEREESASLPENMLISRWVLCVAVGQLASFSCSTLHPHSSADSPAFNPQHYS